jgi:hypothetical protein
VQFFFSSVCPSACLKDSDIIKPSLHKTMDGTFHVSHNASINLLLESHVKDFHLFT